MKKFNRHFVDFLKSISQAFFFDNPFFGAGLLLLLLGFNRELFTSALVSSLIGYCYSQQYSTPKILKATGLIPINGFFFGLAMASLFQRTNSFYLCLFLGASALPLVTKAAFEVLQHWKLSPFIMPYILMTWTVWLCAQEPSLGLQAAAQPSILVLVPAEVTNIPSVLVPIFSIFHSAFLSMGRLLFIPNPLFGLFSLALISAFDPRRGFYFLLGTVVATLTSFALSSGSSAWQEGAFAYGAGLVGLALASFPEKFRLRSILLLSVISSFLTLATDQLLGRLVLPTLSVPYVLTMWLGFLSRLPRFNLTWAREKIPGWRSIQGQEISFEPIKEDKAA